MSILILILVIATLLLSLLATLLFWIARYKSGTVITVILGFCLIADVMEGYPLFGFLTATVLFSFLAFLLFRRRRHVSGATFAVLVLFCLIADVKVLQFKTMIAAGAKTVPPPTTVTSAEAKKADWQPMLTAIGSVSPVQGAMISAELAGTVTEINFQSGAVVKKGDVLLKMDVSPELAQLRSAKADEELAKNDLDRARDLAARKVISTAEFDAAQSKYAQKKATTENIQSTIDKKQIRAPFDGTAGIRAVNPGQMVKVGDPLVSLQTMGEVYFDFALPQQQLADVKQDLAVKVTTDALPGREFDGKLSAINSSIDPATRNVTLQATLDNPDNALRAGMFGRIKVLLPKNNPTLFVPATAVSYAPFGNSVFVIEKKKDDKTGDESLLLRQQFIRTGETRGDFVAVTEGLKAGEQVVSTGVFKLRNGMNVAIDNKLAPKAELAPKPTDS